MCGQFTHKRSYPQIIMIFILAFFYLRSWLFVRLCKISGFALPLPFPLLCNCLIQSDTCMPAGNIFMEQSPRPDNYCSAFLLKIAQGGVISSALTNCICTVYIMLSHLPQVHQYLITDAVVFKSKYSMVKASKQTHKQTYLSNNVKNKP